MDICPKFGKCSEWDVAAGQVLVEATGGCVVNAETGGEVRYNKQNMISPPFKLCLVNVFTTKLKKETRLF